jgi:predicted tellurium resistance membrane protein TerC
MEAKRFGVAFTIILGMIIILIITVLQREHQQTLQLAAIFSGWVTSIIAFYFLDQTTTQAQEQTKLHIQAEEEKKEVERKIVSIRKIVTSDFKIQENEKTLQNAILEIIDKD